MYIVMYVKQIVGHLACIRQEELQILLAMNRMHQPGVLDVKHAHVCL